jgi:hypothetical protein
MLVYVQVSKVFFGKILLVWNSVNLALSNGTGILSFRYQLQGTFMTRFLLLASCSKRMISEKRNYAGNYALKKLPNGLLWHQYILWRLTIKLWDTRICVCREELQPLSPVSITQHSCIDWTIFACYRFDAKFARRLLLVASHLSPVTISCYFQDAFLRIF